MGGNTGITYRNSKYKQKYAPKIGYKMVKSKITDILVQSILKSRSTQSPSLPSHVSSPPPPAVATSQLSHPLPAKPSSHCPCSPAYASQCTVSFESSPPCSDNEHTATVGDSPQTGRNT